MIQQLLLRIATEFGPDQILFSTRANALLWSAADVIICAAFLDIIDRCRADDECAPIRRAKLMWTLFAVSVAATPALFFVESSIALFQAEAFICGLQFFVLFWTAITGMPILIRRYRKLYSL